MTKTYFAHHGVKGMHWGIRRYQYADGSLTPAGRVRYGNGSVIQKRRQDISEGVNVVRTKVTGKQYSDSFLKNDTKFNRIQTSNQFEPYPFYATYKKRDSDKYLGLFGANLVSRADAEARSAERLAKKTGLESDIFEANRLRTLADGMQVYQLEIRSTDKLRVPSDKNAGDITVGLMKDPMFRRNLESSIADSKSKMLRPTQQALFNQAQKALSKDAKSLTQADRIAIYKAFNLSLVYHNSDEIAAQNAFYSELKRKGYNALLDYNDKSYSSYHASRPMIVFDLDSVKLQSVLKPSASTMKKLNARYNAERVVREIPANTVGLAQQYADKTLSECYSYANDKLLTQLF